MYCIHWQKADNISILLQTLHFRERHRFLRTSRLPIGQQPNVGHDVVLERVRRRADVAATTVSTETTRDFANENVLERGRQLPERIFVLVNEVQSRFVLAANDLVPDDDLVVDLKRRSTPFSINLGKGRKRTPCAFVYSACR